MSKSPEVKEEVPKSRAKRIRKKVKKRADLAFRIGLSEADFQKVPNKDPYVTKALLNKIVPFDLRKATCQDNKGYSEIMFATATHNVDYGDAVYLAIPPDPRGAQILRKLEEQQKKQEEIDKQFSNLKFVIQQNNSERPPLQHSIRHEKRLKQVMKHLYSFPDQHSPENVEDILANNEFGTSEQTSCDLRTQQPSLITSTKFFAKKDFSHLRANLRANLEMEERFRLMKLQEMGQKVRENIK
jgi:hypothetical protein